MNADFHINGKRIETERLLLRAFTWEDLDDFFAYASVAGVGEMAGWPHHETREQSFSILQGFIEEDKTFAICLKENGRVIGSLGVEKYGLEGALTEFSPYKGREIGCVLSKEYWGRGLMPEAVQAVIAYLFKEQDLDFLLCGYYDFNGRSKRVQEKCGFRPYRKLVMDTRMGTKEPGVLNLLLHPEKDFQLIFSHPETLIYQEQQEEKASVETERLYIKVASDEEMRTLTEAQTDEELKKAYGEMLALSREYPAQRAWYAAWFLTRKTGEKIGDLCFKGLSADGVAEIGYGLLPEFCGKGYATEAVKAMVAWALRHGARRLEAETDADNRASQRVLQKAGFVPTGTNGEEGPRFVYVGENGAL